MRQVGELASPQPEVEDPLSEIARRPNANGTRIRAAVAAHIHSSSRPGGCAKAGPQGDSACQDRGNSRRFGVWVKGCTSEPSTAIVKMSLIPYPSWA